MIACPSQSLQGCHAWASIVQGTTNYGNHFIEWSLRRLLNLPEPALVFDAYEPMSPSLIEEINRTCDFVINPGCTTLQPGENAAFESFDQITVPKPCFGGCLWEFGKQSRFQLGLRAIGSIGYGMRKRPTIQPDLKIVQKMTQPVGCRDLFTYNVLKQANVESVLTGCPTLLSPDPLWQWKKMEGRRLTVSLCRYALPAQINIIRHLMRTWDVTVLIHEKYEHYAVRFLPGVKKVEFQSVEDFFGYYRDCDAVLTGRLHGALPAVRFGRPVVFFGHPDDSRFSLLKYLGLPIRELSGELKNFESFPEIASPDPAVYEKVRILAESFITYCRTYKIACNLKL